MSDRESFYRHEPIGSAERTLPAEIYNAMRLLFESCGEEALFVPVRSMQYLAVIDREEVIFVDRHRARQIEFAWQHFRPQQRQSLSDPVPYTLVCYEESAAETMKRALWEFYAAVKQLAERHRRDTAANAASSGSIIRFPEAGS